MYSFTISLASGWSSRAASNRYRGESSLPKIAYSAYSFNVIFNLRPESLSPILKSEFPNLSTSLYSEKSLLKLSSFAYIKLPLFHARPIICHSSYYHWFGSLLIFLYELFNRDIINVDSLYRVLERVILDFQDIILSAPVSILCPLSKKHLTSVLWFHISHFLLKFMRHLTSSEARIQIIDTLLLAFLNGLVIHNILYRNIPEKRSEFLLFWSRFQIRLLHVVLVCLLSWLTRDLLSVLLIPVQVLLILICICLSVSLSIHLLHLLSA